MPPAAPVGVGGHAPAGVAPLPAPVSSSAPAPADRRQGCHQGARVPRPYLGVAAPAWFRRDLKLALSELDGVVQTACAQVLEAVDLVEERCT